MDCPRKIDPGAFVRKILSREAEKPHLATLTHIDQSQGFAPLQRLNFDMKSQILIKNI
jgi:hypothetical protein